MRKRATFYISVFASFLVANWYWIKLFLDKIPP
jgi:hypothetical protein